MNHYSRPFYGILFCLITTFFLLNHQSAAAQTTWHAKYYNNRDLSGTAVVERYEDKIFHNWGEGSPHPDINIDNFSAVWNGNVYLNQSTVWRFVATTDDGMRVFINNSPIIDVWYDSQTHTITKDIYLEAGSYPIRVEYYDAGGDAVAQFSWHPSGSNSAPINYWKGEYFNNSSLANQPVLIRDDANINFEWGTGSPAAGTVPNDNFSVRWTRTMPFSPGVYRFTVSVDDGARLWVNNQLLIDAWKDQPLTTYTADLYLPGGNVPLEMLYYDGKDTATVKLSWAPLSSGTAPTTPTTPTAVNWNAAYYNNFSLDGAPAMTRTDTNINFTWGSSSPQPNLINANTFSVRWNKDIQFAAGTYTFKTTVEGGVRLWVNNQLIIDQWQPQYKVVETAANINLPGGSVPVVMEFRKDQGLAQAWLNWTAVGSSSAGNSNTGNSSNTPAPELTGNTAVMNGALYLSVRTGPGTSYEATTYLSKGEVVTLIGRDRFNIWIQIRQANGTEGWVSGRFLTSNIPYSNLPIVNVD